MASMKRSLQPLLLPAATWLSVVALLALVVLGVVLLRDAAILFGWMPGQTWLLDAVWGTHRFSPDAATLGYCVGIGVLGIALMAASCVASRKTALPADQAGQVWLNRGGAATVAESVSADVDGVVGASARVTTKKVMVAVQAADEASVMDVKTEVEARVQQAFAVLPQPPQVTVYVTR